VRASSCAPARFPVLKKLFAEWHTEDVRNMTVKSCLLEGHIEQFCLEVLWGHMQASEFTFEVHQLLMSALLLRLQSGAHSRHGNLVEIKWEDCEKLEPTVAIETEGFAIKVKPGKIVAGQKHQQPVEFYLSDVITNTLFGLWFAHHHPGENPENASNVYVFPSISKKNVMDFTKPSKGPEHQTACQLVVKILGLQVSTACWDNMGANTVRRGNAVKLWTEMRGTSMIP
tara:strand:+ start:99 stop:782 length:684 start_codon:yes stop_codon:yes gene_type:complete